MKQCSFLDSYNRFNNTKQFSEDLNLNLNNYVDSLALNYRNKTWKGRKIERVHLKYNNNMNKEDQLTKLRHKVLENRHKKVKNLLKRLGKHNNYSTKIM